MNNVSITRVTKKIPQTISHIINKQRLSEYRLIFCINSGRAGSNYLAELLNSAPEVYSVHEPRPKMVGDSLNLINQYHYEQTLRKRNFKVAFIKDKLLQLPEKSVYCETNHMFIKTFFDVVMQEFGRQVEVIVLRRYLPRVVKSFIELGYFSERNKSWPLWLSSPNAATASIPCIDIDSNLDQYDLTIAYLIDIEARFLNPHPAAPQMKYGGNRLNRNEMRKKKQDFF